LDRTESRPRTGSVKGGRRRVRIRIKTLSITRISGRRTDNSYEEKGETLEPGQFKKGDSLSVVVVVDDREARGNTQEVRPVVVSNSPP